MSSDHEATQDLGQRRRWLPHTAACRLLPHGYRAACACSQAREDPRSALQYIYGTRSEPLLLLRSPPPPQQQQQRIGMMRRSRSPSCRATGGTTAGPPTVHAVSIIILCYLISRGVRRTPAGHGCNLCSSSWSHLIHTGRRGGCNSMCFSQNFKIKNKSRSRTRNAGPTSTMYKRASRASVPPLVNLPRGHAPPRR